MTESFMDKFKRGAGENAATARAARDKANAAAKKSKEGWEKFKMGYNSKAGQSTSMTPSMPTLNKPVMPCGACRQAMIEYEQRQGEKIEVLLQGNKENIFISESVSNLLPYAFECEELKKS